MFLWPLVYPLLSFRCSVVSRAAAGDPDGTPPPRLLLFPLLPDYRERSFRREIIALKNFVYGEEMGTKRK